MNVSSDRVVTRLADPALAAALSHFVRARVPESEVDDIVQATITDALDADAKPEQDEEIVRWVYGICRHKVVDWFRRTRREVPRDLEGNDEAAVAVAESAPQTAMDLLRWAQKELPEGEEHKKTLEWMLREGEGEKLETIAAEANLPAPRVRQRVSRLRRHFKARWAAQIAALAALLLIAIALAYALRRRNDVVAPAPGPSLEPSSSPTAPAPLSPEMPAWSTQPPTPPPSASASPSAAPSASSPPPPRDTKPPARTGKTAPKGFTSDPGFTPPMGTSPAPTPAPAKPQSSPTKSGSSI